MAQCEYLVVRGLAGEIGRFRGDEGVLLRRGTAVVVRGERGLELGEVVRRSTAGHAALAGAVGELVRLAEEADLRRGREMASRAARLATRAGELVGAMGLPVAVLDAEVQLDGEHGTLVHVRRTKCDIRELIRPLSVEFGLSLNPVDLTAERHDGGCGSCGEGGGCGTGGCGSGACGGATAEELREYFAELRVRMEGRRVSLL